MRDVRQHNFLRLLREYPGKQREFADLIDESPSFVSQWKGGGRPIPDDTARKIEVASGKPHLWLDELHDGEIGVASAHTRKRARLRQLLEAVPEENLEALELLISGLSASHATKKADDSQ